MKVERGSGLSCLRDVNVGLGEIYKMMPNQTDLIHNQHLFSNEVNQLISAFHEDQILADSFTKESYTVSQHLKSWLKLQDKIRVWPPTKKVLHCELTLAYNYLLVCIGENLRFRVKYDLKTEPVEDMVCSTLRRVLQLAYKKIEIPVTVPVRDSDTEREMMKIIQAVEDPIAHFKLLDVLSHVLLLCSLCCLHKKQQGIENRTRQALNALEKLTRICDKSVLQKQVPQKYGLLIHMPENLQGFGEHKCIIVEDVVKLVLLSNHVIDLEMELANADWEWLATIYQCRELMEKGNYTLAMTRLEAGLSQQLDPEAKSKLLCLFAQCYMKQGCPQLALQTYKDALETHKDHQDVLFYLADVYNVLGMEELELQSLNLLIKVLTQQHSQAAPRKFTTEIDDVIMTVCQVMPDISLPCVMYQCAKRCFQLHRYKEAAEQYLVLMRLLDDPRLDSLNIGADIREVMVETAEALVHAQQFVDCIALCDEFYPYLITDDTPAQLSQKAGQSVFGNTSTHNTPPDISNDYSDSGHSLFSPSQNSTAEDNTGNLSLKNKTPPKAFLSASRSSEDRHESDGVGSGKLSLSSKCIQSIGKISRKRMRTSSSDQNEEEQGGDSDVEKVWWTKSLAVRLLLCKADALAVQHSYNDEAMSCMTKALKLLQDSKTSVFKCKSRATQLSPALPSKKRKCLETNATTSHEEFSEDTAENIIGEQLQHLVSPTWAESMVKVALRMAKASLDRHQFVSASNSCQLVMQLQPMNIDAHYLQTTVLRDKGYKVDETSRQWLQERGFNTETSSNDLRTVMEQKQTELKKKQAERKNCSKQWWQADDVQLLKLDIDCLNSLLHQT